MNLRQLEVFFAIMQSGSVTGAARMLNVSQPAISGVLKHAEQRLGMKLFERIGGRLHPTPEAEALLPDVRDIFERVETLSRTMNEMKEGRMGRIVVATTPTLVNGFLPRALGLFRKDSPDVHVSLRSLPMPLAIEAVELRHADMGLVYAPVPDGSLDFELLTSSEIVCVLPKGHKLARKKSIDVADLAGQSVISLGATTMLGMLIDDACRVAGTAPPQVTMEAGSSLTACLLVDSGAGIALVDSTAVATRKFPNLAFRPFTPTVSIAVQLIYPRARPRSRATQNLSAMLKRSVAEVAGDVT